MWEQQVKSVTEYAQVYAYRCVMNVCACQTSIAFALTHTHTLEHTVKHSHTRRLCVIELAKQQRRRHTTKCLKQRLILQFEWQPKERESEREWEPRAGAGEAREYGQLCGNSRGNTTCHMGEMHNMPVVPRKNARLVRLNARGSSVQIANNWCTLSLRQTFIVKKI